MTAHAVGRLARAVSVQGRRFTPPGAYWQHVVLARVALARDELDRVGTGPPLDRVGELLDTAEQAAAQPAWRPRVWLTGSAVNQAFTNLHAARVLLARHVPDGQLEERARSAMVRLQAAMPASEERRRAVEAAWKDAADRVETKRWVLEKALEWAYDAVDGQYARLRNFRNIVYAVSAAMLLLAVGLAVMGMWWPDSIQMCFSGPDGRVCPTGTAPSGRDALLIEVLGATGGALAAAFSIRKLQGTVTPYGVPLALALVKLPLGALSALTGLLLIHGRVVPGLSNLDTSGQILAYAVLFGIGQQAMTVLIDRRAQELLNKVPYKRTVGDAPASTAKA